MKKPVKPIRVFRIYPYIDGKYVNVNIFRTRNQMFDWCKDSDLGRKFSACCRGFDILTYPKRPVRWGAKKDPEYDKLVQEGWKVSDQIGELNFTTASCRIGIISHECLHAVHCYFGWRQRNKKELPEQDERLEEAMCWCLGNLVRQFCWLFYREKRTQMANSKVMVQHLFTRFPQ